MLLKKHLEWTPRMAPVDAVKLAYQSAFGCGHLLAAPEACAEAVTREMTRTPVCGDTPAFVPIGGGLCRLNLAAPAVRALSARRIADMMALTDEYVRARPDNQARFEASLASLCEAAQAGETPFSTAELESYLAGYRAQGCPVVSHSEVYREAFHPAYRVVLGSLGMLVPVLAECDRRLMETGRVTLVIDGMCGSGKTTLSRLLGALYQTTPIQMDDFFLPFAMRTPERMAEPGENVHYERFLREVLLPLQEGCSQFSYHRFDCQTGNLERKTYMRSDVTIIEGSYSHHRAFEIGYQKLDALLVFVTVDADEQLRRLEKRDPERIDDYRARWVPLEKSYFEAYDKEERAHIRLRSQRLT